MSDGLKIMIPDTLADSTPGTCLTRS